MLVATGLVKHIRYVTGNHDPVAAANLGPLYGLAPLAVTFDASASTDADHDALSPSPKRHTKDSAS